MHQIHVFAILAMTWLLNFNKLLNIVVITILQITCPDLKRMLWFVTKLMIMNWKKYWRAKCSKSSGYDNIGPKFS